VQMEAKCHDWNPRSVDLNPMNGRETKRRDIPIGAGKKAKHTLVDKAVKMGLPSICSRNPADTSTLMRPVASAAFQSRCVMEVW
jgi:hypothetical protein